VSTPSHDFRSRWLVGDTLPWPRSLVRPGVALEGPRHMRWAGQVGWRRSWSSSGNRMRSLPSRSRCVAVTTC